MWARTHPHKGLGAGSTWSALALGRARLVLLGLAVAGGAACESDAEAPAPSEGLTAPTEDPPADPPADAPEEGKGTPSAAGPPKRIFAKRFVAKVRSKPDARAPRIGYLRAGSVLQATSAEPVGRDGCRGGWWELETGGFVCGKRDVIAFRGERLPALQSTQPDRSAKLPYEYGFVRRDRTPMYRRLPSAEEAEEHEARAKERKESSTAKAPAAEKAASKSGGSGSRAAKGRADAGPAAAASTATKGDPNANGTDAGVGQDKAATPRKEARAREAPGAPADAGTPDSGPLTLDRLQAEEDSVVMRWLMRGFYVALDRELEKGRRRYWRTYQNGFVPFRSVMTVDGSDFHGMELADEVSLPVGFTISGRARRYEPRGEKRIRRARSQPDYHHAFNVLEERELRGRTYFLAEDDYLYRDRYVTVVRDRPRPEEIPAGVKWLDVDLSNQTLVAYEGDRPVFATLISSGRVKSEHDPEQNHETPSGVFRVTAKHLTAKMDGDNAIDGPYSIDDVPYVMYFELAYALHSAFWHRLFGRPKSHGCVNISPLNTKHIFK
jgi:hypothetical protein